MTYTINNNVIKTFSDGRYCFEGAGGTTCLGFTTVRHVAQDSNSQHQISNQAKRNASVLYHKLYIHLNEQLEDEHELDYNQLARQLPRPVEHSDSIYSLH